MENHIDTVTATASYLKWTPNVIDKESGELREPENSTELVALHSNSSPMHLFVFHGNPCFKN